MKLLGILKRVIKHINSKISQQIIKYTKISTSSKFYLNHLHFSNVSTDTTVLLEDKMSEKFMQLFNILHQSNLKKSHAAILKSMNEMRLI